MGSMLPYIAAPWILWDMISYSHRFTGDFPILFPTASPPLPRPCSAHRCWPRWHAAPPWPRPAAAGPGRKGTMGLQGVKSYCGWLKHNK